MRLLDFVFLLLLPTVSSIIRASPKLPKIENSHPVYSPSTVKPLSSPSAGPSIGDLYRIRHVTLDCAVPMDLISEATQQAGDMFRASGGHKGTYQGKSWYASRIYYDGGKIWSPEESTYFDPLLVSVRRKLGSFLQLSVVDDADLATCFPLESAFTNNYIGDTCGSPRDMAEHVDCDWRGVAVPLSVVVQGCDPSDVASSIQLSEVERPVLGVLDCRGSLNQDPVSVSLRAGDCLVLAGAHHAPHPVEDGASRIVFVMFFSGINLPPNNAK